MIGETPEARLPLSVVVDRMAGDGARDEEFVRRFSAWFHEHAARLRLDALDALGLEDVVLTFRMKGHVALVATGHRPDHPGEVTVRFHERDFPAVSVVVGGAPRETPYEVCTLDHSVEGRRVALTLPLPLRSGALPAGTEGRALVAATIGSRRELRVAFDALGGAPVSVLPAAVHWLDEAPAADTAARAPEEG